MSLKIKTGDNVPISDINVTPFIDVMLVLLIIFMVTMPMLTSTVSINLPAIGSESSIQQNDPIILNIDADKQFFLGDDLIQVQELSSRLQQVTQNNKDMVIFLKVDKTIPYDSVLQTMAKLRGMGYLRIGLVGLQDNK